MRGTEDQRGRAVDFRELFLQLKAADRGHAHVDDHHRGLGRIELVEERLGVRIRQRLHADALQQEHQGLPEILVVVHHVHDRVVAHGFISTDAEG